MKRSLREFLTPRPMNAAVFASLLVVTAIVFLLSFSGRLPPLPYPVWFLALPFYIYHNYILKSNFIVLDYRYGLVILIQLCYWYFISCILTWIYQRVRRK